MNNIGTMFGYLYQHTEREQFNMNTYDFWYWNDTCFSIYMLKSHNHLTTGDFTVPGAIKEGDSENGEIKHLVCWMSF